MKERSGYDRRVRAWCMYDWANSAFATTILAAVLPIYYSQVAGANLPSEAVATAYWSVGLSVSLFIVAILSPILGTVSDVMRGKRRFLTVFVGIGIVATGLLVLVDTGDWLLASLLFVFGRIGFTGANVFYDALLPHVAREDDRDRVSTRGFAMGYLGGGLLLAINVVMIQVLPGTWGPRLSFLTVSVWWAIFSIPILTRVPEPPSATATLAPRQTVLGVSFRRLAETLRDVRKYRQLFKYLMAFLIYNDGIGTIIGVAAIYGAGRRPVYLAFILFSLVSLPIMGVIGVRVLPGMVTGAPLPPYEATSEAVGEGVYLADDPALGLVGAWKTEAVAADMVGGDQDVVYVTASEPGARWSLVFNGQKIRVTHSLGPDHGVWAVEMDGRPLLDEDTGRPIMLDGYRPTMRYGARETFQADEPGIHTLSLINTSEGNKDSSGVVMALADVEILPAIRQSNLAVILGLILGVEVVGAALALLLGRALFSRLAATLDTKRSIILSLTVYMVIAVWGFFLDSVVEFWILAWMVAMVQGGSQALSRSLYASMSPAAKSGEFFGLYGVMEKFSAIIGPLLFAAAVAAFDSSRPAVLSLIVLFAVGIYLLRRVDVEEGRRVAQQEDAEILGAAYTLES